MQADPNVRAADQAAAELPRVQQQLAQAEDNLTKLPRVAAGDRREQSIADANERIQRATAGNTAPWKIVDDPKRGRVVAYDDKAAPVIDLFERYERLSRGGRTTPTTEKLANDIVKEWSIPGISREEALARAARLSEQRHSLQRDLKLTTEGPAKLPALKRDPARAAMEGDIATLRAQRDQLVVLRDNPQARAVRDEYNNLNAQVEQQRNTYKQLQQSEIPDDTRTVLLEMEQDVRAKQARLGEEEANVDRMAALHGRHIDEAEGRVELATNMHQEMLRRAADAKDADVERSLLRQANAHRDGELHTAKQAFTDAQKPVTQARKRRDLALGDLRKSKENLARSKWTPPEVGIELHRINSTEETLVRQARIRVSRTQTEWKLFPEIDAPPRRGVYTFEERDRLHELYDIVNNTHPVDRAGAGSSYLVRQARETIGRITDAGGPRGPRDTNALLEANKVLLAHRNGGLNTAAHQRYRAALTEINAIERVRSQGTTYAQHEFGEVRRIAEMVEDLEDLRTPMQMPGKGSKRWKAIAASPRKPGGPRDTFGRAVENRDITNDWIDNYSQDLIDAGAIEETQVEFITRRARRGRSADQGVQDAQDPRQPRAAASGIARPRTAGRHHAVVQAVARVL